MGGSYNREEEADVDVEYVFGPSKMILWVILKQENASIVCLHFQKEPRTVTCNVDHIYMLAPWRYGS